MNKSYTPLINQSVPKWVGRKSADPISVSTMNEFRDGTLTSFHTDVSLASVVHGLVDLDLSKVINTLGSQEDIVKAKYYVGEPSDTADVALSATPDYTWTFTKDSDDVITDGSGTTLYTYVKGNRQLLKDASTARSGNTTNISTNATDIAALQTANTTQDATISTMNDKLTDTTTKMQTNYTWRTTNSPKIGDLSSYDSSSTLVDQVDTNVTAISTNKSKLGVVEQNISASFPYIRSDNGNRTIAEDIDASKTELAQIRSTVYPIEINDSGSYYGAMIRHHPSFWHGFTPVNYLHNIDYQLSAFTAVNNVKTASQVPYFSYLYRLLETYKSQFVIKWHEPSLNIDNFIFPSATRGYPLIILQVGGSSANLIHYQNTDLEAVNVSKSNSSHHYQIWFVVREKSSNALYLADVYAVDLTSKTLTKIDGRIKVNYTSGSLFINCNLYENFDFFYIEEPTSEIMSLIYAPYFPNDVAVTQSNISLEKLQNFRITHINAVNSIVSIKFLTTSVNQAIAGFVRYLQLHSIRRILIRIFNLTLGFMTLNYVKHY